MCYGFKERLYVKYDWLYSNIQKKRTCRVLLQNTSISKVTPEEALDSVVQDRYQRRDLRFLNNALRNQDSSTLRNRDPKLDLSRNSEI